MARVHDGDARAFAVVFDRHADVAYSLAYRMCGRRRTAEDVVQEAYLSLWRSGAHYDRTRGSVRSWVLSVVHHRAIDTFRRETVRSGRDVSDDGLAERLASRPTPRRRFSSETTPARCAPRWRSCPASSAR